MGTQPTQTNKRTQTNTMNTMKLFLVLSLLLTMSFNSLTKAEQGQGVRRLLKPRARKLLGLGDLEEDTGMPKEQLKEMGFSSEEINGEKTEATRNARQQAILALKGRGLPANYEMLIQKLKHDQEDK